MDEIETGGGVTRSAAGEKERSSGGETLGKSEDLSVTLEVSEARDVS